MEQFVRVACGAGREPKNIPWTEGMTVARVLEAAEIDVDDDHTATLGRRRVIDPETESVQPNDIVVVAGKPGNGGF